MESREREYKPQVETAEERVERNRRRGNYVSLRGYDPEERCTQKTKFAPNVAKEPQRVPSVSAVIA